jgi:hypothetical protein
MITGCLLLLGVLAATFYVEYGLLEAHGYRLAWLAALSLAFGVTMAVGSLQGALLALWKALHPESDPNTWRDGGKVRVGGVVQSRGQTITAPFSGREALAVEYELVAADRTVEESARASRAAKPPPSARGLDVAPLGLFASNTYVAISGTPWLRHLPEDQHEDESALPRAARLLATTEWATGDLGGGVPVLRDLVRTPDAEIRLHVLNRPAADLLIAPPGQPVAGRRSGGPAPDLDGRQAEEAILQRLGARRWAFKERVLSPGTPVTVEGTFRANPPRIDVGRWMDPGVDGIRPGLAATTAWRQWWQALAFTVAFGAFAAGAHYVVYAEDGIYYRQLLEWLDRTH